MTIMITRHSNYGRKDRATKLLNIRAQQEFFILMVIQSFLVRRITNIFFHLAFHFLYGIF